MSLSLLSMILSNGSTSAVDTVRLSLEADSAFWFRLVKYSGYAVAAGCLLEGPETFVTIKRWWLLRFRDIEREETKEDKKSWIVPCGAVGLIVIVLGIVAETYFEGKVSDADARIREHESQVVSAAEADAASANGRAADAEKRAGKLEAANLTVGQDLLRNQSGLEAERRKTAEIEREAAEMQIDVLHNEQELTNRRITLPEGAEFDELKKYNGTRAIIEVVTGDPTSEPMQLATSISFVLNDAGWKPQITDAKTSMIPPSFIGKGVQVITAENPPGPNAPLPSGRTRPPFRLSTASKAAAALVSLLELDLKRSGVKMSHERTDEVQGTFSKLIPGFRFSGNTVLILVGPKPVDLWYPSKRQSTGKKATHTKPPTK